MLLAHISDTHFRSRGEKLYGFIDVNAANADVVSQLNALRERPDAVVVSGDIRQRHGNQLDIFDLGAGIQGATIGIPGGLPLPDARLCGIGGEAQLVKELIHIAVHIR